jgi:hypothetical protein
MGVQWVPALCVSRRSRPSVMSWSGQTWSVGVIQSSPMEAWRGRVNHVGDAVGDVLGCEGLAGGVEGVDLLADRPGVVGAELGRDPAGLEDTDAHVPLGVLQGGHALHPWWQVCERTRHPPRASRSSW